MPKVLQVNSLKRPQAASGSHPRTACVVDVCRPTRAVRSTRRRHPTPDAQKSDIVLLTEAPLYIHGRRFGWTCGAWAWAAGWVDGCSSPAGCTPFSCSSACATRCHYTASPPTGARRRSPSVALTWCITVAYIHRNADAGAECFTFAVSLPLWLPPSSAPSLSPSAFAVLTTSAAAIACAFARIAACGTPPPNLCPLSTHRLR